MKHHLILIKNDIFKICKRLKKINKNFVVYFNKLNCCFELYSKRFNRLVFEANLGKELTYKTLIFAWQNGINNLDTLIKSIDKENAKLEKENSQNLQDFSKQVIGEMLKFADRKNCDVDFSKEKIFRRENDS